MPRLAANIAYLFTELPFLARFGAAAAEGFTAVELQFPYATPAQEVRAELEKHNLTMLGLNTGHGGEGEFGLAAVPGREREFEAQVTAAIDYAAAIGGRAIHCLAGKVPQAQRAQGQRTFVSNLRAAADRAAPHGLTLLIEPINTTERPDYFLSVAEHAADIIAEVDRPNVKIQFDFYHAQIVRGNLLARFEACLPLIGHVQIAGVPGRHEPDDCEIDYPFIFQAIDTLGYTGFVAGEYHPRGRTQDGLGWARPYGVVPSRQESSFARSPPPAPAHRCASPA
jgi:hydroxypyruvate isomerase